LRCSKARKLLGEYIDGELPPAKREDLEKHVAGCPECSSRESLLRNLLSELASLPQQVLSPQQESRLRATLASSLARPSRDAYLGHAPGGGRRAISRYPATVAAAAAFLLLAAGLAYGLVSIRAHSNKGEAGRPTAMAETPETERGARLVQALVEPSGEEVELPVEPVLDLSGRQFQEGDLAAFSGDLTARLQFYSAYWYPLGSYDRAGEALEALRVLLIRSLLGRASAVDASRRLEGILYAVITRLEGAKALPCYVAYVLWEGKRPAWLVSLSTPGDALALGDVLLGLDASTVEAGSPTGKATYGTAGWEGALNYLYHLLLPARKGAGDAESAVRSAVNHPVKAGREGETVPGLPPHEDASQEGKGEEIRDLVENRLRAISPAWGGDVLLNAWESGDYAAVLRMITSDWRGFYEAALERRDLRLVPRLIWVVDASTGEILHPSTITR